MNSDEMARQRLAEDVRRTSKKPKLGLRDVGVEFWKHPSPWLISGTLVVTTAAKIASDDWAVNDLWGPIALVALFPVLEWVIHVFILHWRPRKIAGLMVDSQLARDHRRHHTDPRNIPLIFIPWQTLIAVIIGYNALAFWLFPTTGQALSFMASVAATGLVYEWTHYLIHSDYKPKSRLYKAVWRNHRLHHYKNEHYWFSVTTSGTSDRLFGTYPQQDAVPTSPTAKNLHGQALLD